MPPSLVAHGPTESFPYRIEREAGTGAMGVVYLAIDVALERPVAIKVLKGDGHAETNDEHRKRFLQEARAAASLNHPGVTTIYQIGQVEGAPYIAMEWLEGRTLEEVVKQDGAVALERASALTFELLDVLGAAHQADVVHRDVKPSNLIVLENGRLKVTDFGIALLNEDRQLVKTVAGSVMATPRYASPEQLQGLKVDGRSDLFSAAVVFYHLLTRAMPWGGKTLAALVTAIMNDPPTPVREHVPELPAGLEAWFERALVRDRNKRFAAAGEMAEELRRALASAEGTEQALESSRTTKIMTPPTYIYVAAQAPTSWAATLEFIRSWGGREAGTVTREDLLAKLLEQPLHTEPFAGVALYGTHGLFIEKGTLLAAVDIATGKADMEAELAERAEATLCSVPERFNAGLVTLLAGLHHAAPARHENLDSLSVNLAAFGGKLQDQGFEGAMRLEAGGDPLEGDRGGKHGRHADVLLLDGRTELAVVSGDWPQDPCEVGWAKWIGELEATVSFHDRTVRPPVTWYRRGFKDLELTLTPEPVTATGKQKTPTLTGVLRPEDLEDTRLFRTDLTQGGAPAGLVPASGAPAARLLDWMLGELPRLLLESKRSDAWKYLADWLLLVRKARLYADLERPGSSTSDFFDLVTEDADGKVLHLGHRLGFVDTARFESFLERVVTAKKARIKGGDVGGVVLASPKFSSPVLDAYKSLLHKGLGNVLLGLDKSLGYEGFVRLSARRGFHLLLVEEKGESFRPRFIS